MELLSTLITVSSEVALSLTGECSETLSVPPSDAHSLSPYFHPFYAIALGPLTSKYGHRYAAGDLGTMPHSHAFRIRYL